MQVIGITGRKRHGKDTAARELVLQGYTVVRFADGLKEMLRAFYALHGISAALIARRIEGDLKEVPCVYLNGKTPRQAMQFLGTEWGRHLIDESLWTDSLVRRARLCDKVVIPDVRFANECAAVRALGGKVVRVAAHKRVPPGEHSDHLSELEIDSLPVDSEIDNNGTPFELAQAVRALGGVW